MKVVHWIGSSRKDLIALPEEVQDEFGYALYLAQQGEKPDSAKPLKGFHGAGVLELVENSDGNTYRAVYTVRFEEAIYVLHCFQKKSKAGISTPKQELDLVVARLRMAEQEHDRWKKSNQK
jgi:phage-related protein